jgi:hypothetical protein
MFPDRTVRRAHQGARALDGRAAENLRFIRETMERSASFTAVPGMGGMAIGATAGVAAWVASQQATPAAWLKTWLLESLVAVLIGAWTVNHKARAAGQSVLSGAGRKFALSLSPPLVAGALLTLDLYHFGHTGVLPGLWLLLYGAGIVTAGAFSVKVVPVMGLCLMSTGAMALFSPAAWGDAYMAVGFGGVHIVFGAVIARRFGG